MPIPLMLASRCPPGDPLKIIERMQSEGSWSWEVKVDGIRALVQVTDGQVRVTNRRARDITYRYPDVVDRLTGFPVDVILDGEIACMDERGRPDFARIHRRDAQGSALAARHLAGSLPAQFVGFDVLSVRDVDVRMLDYGHRREELAHLAPQLGDYGVVVPPVSTDGLVMWQAVCDLALEGLVAKRRDSRYQGRRSPAWVKIKRTRRASLLVSGWEAGEGSRASTFGALRLAALGGAGELVQVGSVGSGFSDADVRSMWDLLQRPNEPIVVEVEFLEFSPGGQLRQPVFKGVRQDVPFTDCTVAQLTD